MLLAPQDHRTRGSGLVVEKQKCGCVNKHIYPGTPEFGVAFKTVVHPEMRSPSGWILSAFSPRTHLDFASVLLPSPAGWSRRLWMGNLCCACISCSFGFKSPLNFNIFRAQMFSVPSSQHSLGLAGRRTVNFQQWWKTGLKLDGCDALWWWKEKQNEESPLAGEGKQELGNILSWEGWSRPQNPTLRALPKYSQTQLPPVPSPGSSSFFLVNICTNLSNPDH